MDFGKTFFTAAVNNGNLDGAARSEVLETAKEIMKVKNPIAVNQVFDFSLIEDAR
jgi:hypothetical protein